MPEVVIKIKKPHAGQLRARVLLTPYRNRIYLCGRRWGKTTELKQLALLVIERGYRIGLFCPEFKDISETWAAVVSIFQKINDANDRNNKPYHIDITAKVVRLITKGDPDEAPCFECWTLANTGKQDSGRGRKYNIAIYEETQKIDSDVLQHHHQQVTMAVLADYKGKCFFFGTPPNSKLHYFYKLICRGAANNPLIANSTDLIETDIVDNSIITYRAPTSDNPFIDENELEAIKRTLPPLIYQQEFEATCVEYANRPFCHVLQDTNTHNKVFAKNTIPFHPAKTVYIGFDFNKNPMAVTISQSSDPLQEWYVIKELGFNAGEKGNIYGICEIIRAYFETLNIHLNKNGESYLPVDMFVTGDATGDISSAYRLDNLTFYDIICKELGLSKKTLRVPKVNPRHTERHAQINDLFIYHPNFLIAKKDCPRLYGDLMNTVSTQDLGIDKKKYDPHYFDALGYTLSVFLPRSIRSKLL